MVQEKSGAEKYGNKELTLLKQHPEHCRKENEALKELAASQKKIIGMMERKKNEYGYVQMVFIPNMDKQQPKKFYGKSFL